MIWQGVGYLAYYASVRLDVRRIDSIKQGDEIIGNRTRIRVVKNKVAPPFKQAEFDIMYGLGISKDGNILDTGVAADIINKAGSWYSYGEYKLGQGRENAKDFLRDNPEIAKEIENKIRVKYGLIEEVDTNTNDENKTK